MKNNLQSVRIDIGVLILAAPVPESEQLYADAGLGNPLDWFRALLPMIPPKNIRMMRILSEGLPPSVPEQLIILPGSGYGADEILKRVPDYAAFLREKRAEGKRMLGVCSGHQVFGSVFGGTVVKNPKGPEIGTSLITATGHGMNSILFHGVPYIFSASESHYDSMTIPAHLPKQILATSPLDFFQIAQYEDDLTMQFHPEITGAMMRKMLELKRLQYFGIDAEAYERCQSAVEDTPFARQLIHNYMHYVVGPSLARGAGRRAKV